MRAKTLIWAVCVLAMAAAVSSCRLYWSPRMVSIPDYVDDVTDNYACSELDVFIRQPAVIDDLDVDIGIDHPDLSELEAWLESPQGTVVPLFHDIDGEGLYALIFDDDGEGVRPVQPWNPPAGFGPWGGTVQIQDYELRTMGLFLFDGEDPNGVWRLCVLDRQTGNAGHITHFGLRINGEW